MLKTTTKPIVVVSRWNFTVSVTQMLEIMSPENFLGDPGRFVDGTSATREHGEMPSQLLDCYKELSH